MNYPSNIKKTYKKQVNYSNRGMDLENLINMTNEYLLEKDIAVIYKKPTPIQIVKYDYEKKRITDAYYKTQSTLDYNGIYQGYYIEFDAKNTNLKSFPISNIASHQLDHIKKINKQNGIVFLMIMINSEIYAIKGEFIINYIESTDKKSISYEYIKENGIKLNYNYLKGVDYIPALEEFIKEKM